MSENKKPSKTKHYNAHEYYAEFDKKMTIELEQQSYLLLKHENANFVKACRAICICPSYKSSTDCTCKTYQWN